MAPHWNKALYTLFTNLKTGKSAGNDHVDSEHFMYASDKIYVYLCILFIAMMIYGHIPFKLMGTILISLEEDKKGNVTNEDNYQSIAITYTV